VWVREEGEEVPELGGTDLIMFSWIRRIICKHEWLKTDCVTVPSGAIIPFEVTGAYEERCAKCMCARVVILGSYRTRRNGRFIAPNSTETAAWPRTPMSQDEAVRFSLPMTLKAET
jgi:hypothetical protein